MPLTQYNTSFNRNRLSIIPLNYESVIMFYHNFYTIFPFMVRIGPYRPPALHDTILNMCIISNIDIIQNDGILDIAVVADVSFLKDHRIFYLTVHNTSAGDQAVPDACSHIILGRRQIINPGINIRILLEEIIPDLRMKEIHVRLKVIIHGSDITPVFFDLVTVDTLHILITDQNIFHEIVSVFFCTSFDHLNQLDRKSVV